MAADLISFIGVVSFFSCLVFFFFCFFAFLLNDNLCLGDVHFKTDANLK